MNRGVWCLFVAIFVGLGLFANCGPAGVCTTKDDCPTSSEQCIDGKCVKSCAADGDCASGEACTKGVCTANSGSEISTESTSTENTTSDTDSGTQNPPDTPGSTDKVPTDKPITPETPSTDGKGEITPPTEGPPTEVPTNTESTADGGMTDILPEQTQDSLPPEQPPTDLGPCKTGDSMACYSGLQGTAGKGECKEGKRYCTPQGAWGPCIDEVTPQTELCNAKDDDCDGLIDEDFTSLGGSCLSGKGECNVQGRYACKIDGKGVYCSAKPTTPQTELCDGKDNDCDGVIDNGFPGLDQSCFVGKGECRRQGRLVCKNDGSGTECTAQAGKPQTEICDGRDNDCDGQTDEDFPTLGNACTGQNLKCTIKGKFVCKTDGTGVECDIPTTISPEVCDGKDNDCDGQSDEDFPLLGQTCVVGKGLCARQGKNICTSDGKGIVCDVIAGTPAKETCDGKDNDCDGLIDEDWSLKDTTCTTGLGACRTTTKYQCKADGSGVECVTKIKPVPELCNNIDDDCDGQTDENFSQKGQQCTNTGACGGQPCPCSKGVFRCSADQTKLECYTQTSASKEICDNIDNDCDGQVDENLGTFTCGTGACLNTAPNCVNGKKGTCTPKSNVGTEICDSIDNNCDGVVDEGCTCRPSKPIYVFGAGHSSSIYHFVLTPDGKQLLTVGNDSFLKIWDFKSGQLLQDVNLSTNSPRYLTMRPDGKQYAFIKQGISIEIRDATTHQIVRNINASGASDLQYSPDGKFIVTRDSRNIKIWQVSTGSFIGSLQHTDSIYSMAFSPDSKTLAVGHYRTISFWNFSTVTLIKKESISGSNHFYSMVFTPNSKTLMAGDSRGKIFAIDNATRVVQNTLSVANSTSQINSMDIDSTGKYLVSIDTSRNIRIWDAAQAKLLQTTTTNDTYEQYVKFVANTQAFVSLNNSKQWIVHRNAPSGQLVRRFFGHTSSITETHMSNNGERFLSIDYSNYHVYIWKRNSRSVLHALRWSNDRPRAGRMTPDGKIAIIGFYARNGLSNDIRIVNADTGSEILALNGHLNNTYEVVIDELGQRFATRGDDNRVRVWEVKTGKEVLSITAANQPRRIQINDDGSLIALSYQVSSSYTLEIWDINQKKKLYSTTDSRIYLPDAMTFHRTTSTLAVARSRNIYTWDFKNNVIATFTQPNSGNTLTRLQYSFDGEFLAAARHQEMLIYSTQNQKLLETLPLGSSPTGLSFAKDGKTILVSASDRRIHLFECPCKAGNTRQCYTQPFGNPGKGICKYGTQTCKPDSSWGACTGDTSAQVETSDGTDQDCNGYIDDPFADLKVQTITATPSSLKVGDTTAIQVCITNVGNANSESLPAKVRLYLGLNNADIPNSAQKLTDNTPQATYQDLSFGSIKAGAQTCQTISIKLPFIFPGTRYIGAFVDHDKQVTETDENNNITHTPITVVP